MEKLRFHKNCELKVMGNLAPPKSAILRSCNSLYTRFISELKVILCGSQFRANALGKSIHFDLLFVFLKGSQGLYTGL